MLTSVSHSAGLSEMVDCSASNLDCLAIPEDFSHVKSLVFSLTISGEKAVKQ